jgi:transmembrane sensor
MQPKETDRQLLLRYIEGNCTEEQLALIKEYLRDEAYRESLNHFLQEEWKELQLLPLPDFPELDQRYDQFRSLVADKKEKAVVRPERVTVRPLFIRRLAQAAAVAAVFTGVLLAGWYLWRGQDHAAWKVVHNGPGKTNRIILPDSSIVDLAAASTLKYREDYGRTNRQLLLEGEAYFIVRHGGLHPFSVTTGQLTTVDIGTEFDIRYQPGQPSIEVAVTSGAVVITRQTPEGQVSALARLHQQQQLYYNTNSHQFRTDSLEGETPGEWRLGIMSFHKQTLKEVAAELERHYGVSIYFDNPGADTILITTRLNKTSLEDALDIITRTAGIQYTKRGDTIRMKMK